jgi:hypothetical protein
MALDVSRETKAIVKDIGELIEGEVLFDELSRAMYSSGASIYRIKPLGIVQARVAPAMKWEKASSWIFQDI